MTALPVLARSPGHPPENHSLPRLAAVWRRLRFRAAGIAPERWLLILFVVLLVAFCVALLSEPSVGRGGR